METILFAFGWFIWIVIGAMAALVIVKKAPRWFKLLHVFGWLYTVECFVYGKYSPMDSKVRRWISHALTSDWVCYIPDQIFCKRGKVNIRIMNLYRRLFDLNYAGNRWYKSLRWYLKLYKLGYYYSGSNGLWDCIRLNFERDGVSKHAIVDIDYGEGKDLGDFETDSFSYAHGGPENVSLYRWDENPDYQKCNVHRYYSDHTF